MAKNKDTYEEADGMITDWDWLLRQPMYLQRDVIKGLRRERKINKKEYMKRHAKKE